MHIKKTVKASLISISALVTLIAITNWLTIHQLSENNEEQTYIVKMINIQEEMANLINKLVHSNLTSPETILYQFQNKKIEFNKLYNTMELNKKEDIFKLFIKDIQDNQGIKQALDKIVTNAQNLEDIFFKLYELHKQNKELTSNIKQLKIEEENNLYKLKKEILYKDNNFNSITLSTIERYRDKFLANPTTTNEKQWFEKLIQLSNNYNTPLITKYINRVKKLITYTQNLRDIKQKEDIYISKTNTILNDNKEIGFYIEDIVENALASQIKNAYTLIVALLILTLIFVFYLAHKIYNNVYVSIDEIEYEVEKGLIEIKALNEEIEATQREIILTMSSIAEKHDDETDMHVKRVAHYCYLLAYYAGLSKKDCELIKLASPMHDIGKVAISDTILQKAGPLTDKEREIIQQHTVYGYKMLKHSKRELLKITSIIAYEHHERWDGKGYPLGLKEEEIHIFARITAIADVFDALSSKRPYKEPWTDEDIIAFMKEQRGKQFDPNLIDIFLEHIDEFLQIRNTLEENNTIPTYTNLLALNNTTNVYLLD